ncbi:glycosyltransferase family 2 protein [Candidatus Bathyarchaeota archaeon]|nr:glycosyltransferase family 2 protein [Candidatus Bathyarchaeota archaeon]
MGARISVIVLNWNGMKWLQICLSSILGQDAGEDFEVLLVDNGSTDGSVRYAEKNFPSAKVVELGRNYGFAEGNNKALNYAQGEYLVFVNTDTRAEAGWLKNLVNAADEHPEYQILCSIQIPSQERNRIRTLNAFGDATLSPYESDSTVTDSVFASGACFLIRRSWIEKLGYLFDPYYFFYAEDIELSLRTVLLGGQIGYVRDSRIAHYIGGAGLLPAKTSFYATRNLLLTYYKLFRLRNFFRVFLVRIAYLAPRFLARRQQLANNIGMVRGTLSFLATFPYYNRYRRVFAKRKKRDDRFIFERFLYRRRTERLFLKRGIYGTLSCEGDKMLVGKPLG